MALILNRQQIQETVASIDIVNRIEEGFRIYSEGRTVVPPVGEMVFKDPPGETHIKYGFIKGDDDYVIKIASGFYQNPKLDLPSSQGLMLLFCQKTGQLKGILQDNGLLTDIRTAAAGAVVAKYMAPRDVKAIGIIGAGIQAKLQVKYLDGIIQSNEIIVWTPNQKEIPSYLEFFKESRYQIRQAQSISELAAQANLIVTTTPSRVPLLQNTDIRPGTHITAVGSDTGEKTELAPEILEMADIIVSDSIDQSHSRGEIFKASAAYPAIRDRVLELGTGICRPVQIRKNERQITVADLTGVAIQDIQIAKAVYYKTIKGDTDEYQNI